MTARESSISLGAQAALFATFMLTVFPITLLGVGLSGGELLSIDALVRDMLRLNPAIFLRLSAWLILSAPLIWSALLIGQWRSLRQKRNVS